MSEVGGGEGERKGNRKEWTANRGKGGDDLGRKGKERRRR